MDKRLVKKIEHLLNLSKGTSFEGEADSALQKAYALMKLHGISEEDVKYISKEDVLGEIDQESLSEDSRQYRKWETELLSAIARLFDSHIIKTTWKGSYTKKAKLAIVGREANRRTIVAMYNWIHDRTIKEARRVGGRYASARVAYCNGVADSILCKVVDIKSQDKTKTDKWGIVPMDEVNAWIRENIENVKDGIFRTGQSHDAGAYAAGIRAGDNTSLNRQFGFKAIEAK